MVMRVTVEKEVPKTATRKHRKGRKTGLRARALAALWNHDMDLCREATVLCGVDEVGRGPLAGPVVAACVVLDLGCMTVPGLNDSKKVPPEAREELYAELMEKALCIGIGECSHVEIDQINILQASLLAMKRALQKISLQPDLVLVDGNQLIPQLGMRQQCIIGGDGRSACIAAASIVAKVTRDRQMCELAALYPHYGFENHKGYSTREHLDALERHGPCTIHRKSFLRGRNQLSLFGDMEHA